MRTEIALYLNRPKYSSAGASALFRNGRRLCRFAAGLAGFGDAFVAPAVVATSARPSITVRIMLRCTHFAPGRAVRGQRTTLGARRSPARWIQQLIAKRRSAHAPDGTCTGSTSCRSQLANATNVSVSGATST